MKKLIIINTLLLLLLSIIPTNKTQIAAAPTKKIKNNLEVVELATTQENRIVETTSRSLETEREKTEIIKNNLELSVNSDLRILSNLTAEEFDKMLANTELAGIGIALEQIEKEFGINGLYIMGLACLESAYGTSNFARERNNLVGWNAVDSDPKKATYFKSKEECLIFVANRLKTNYLSEDGKYFNGFTAEAINKKYSSDQQHAEKIISIVNKLKNKLQERSY